MDEPLGRDLHRYSNYPSRTPSRSPRRGKRHRPQSDSDSIRDTRRTRDRSASPGETRRQDSGISASTKRRRRDERSISPARSRSYSRERGRRRSRSWSRSRARSRSRDRHRRRRGGARYGRRSRRDRSRTRSRSRSRSRGYDDSRSPPRRRARHRSRERDRPANRRGRGRERYERRPIHYWSDPDTHDLFFAALEDALRRNRLPFNISLVNDVMRRLAPHWSIRGSNYPSFQKLCKEKEQQGFLTIGRIGNSNETVAIVAVRQGPRPLQQQPDVNRYDDRPPPYDEPRGRRRGGRERDRRYGRGREERERSYDHYRGTEDVDTQGHEEMRDRDHAERSVDTDAKPPSGSAVTEDLVDKRAVSDRTKEPLQGEEVAVSGVTEEARQDRAATGSRSGGWEDVGETTAAAEMETRAKNKTGSEEVHKHVMAGGATAEDVPEKLKDDQATKRELSPKHAGAENDVGVEALLLMAESGKPAKGPAVALDSAGDVAGRRNLNEEMQTSDGDTGPKAKMNALPVNVNNAEEEKHPVPSRATLKHETAIESVPAAPGKNVREAAPNKESDEPEKAART